MQGTSAVLSAILDTISAISTTPTVSYPNPDWNYLLPIIIPSIISILAIHFLLILLILLDIQIKYKQFYLYIL